MKPENPIPKPLLLHLKSAQMDEATLKAVTAAGYVPVAVETFNDVRLIGPIERMDVVSKAAMKAILDSTYDDVREKFAVNTARALAQ